MRLLDCLFSADKGYQPVSGGVLGVGKSGLELPDYRAV